MTNVVYMRSPRLGTKLSKHAHQNHKRNPALCQDIAVSISLSVSLLPHMFPIEALQSPISHQVPDALNWVAAEELI